jgi:hypothetical protein
MTAYPPEWSVHGEVEFESFHLTSGGEDAGMGMVLLAKADLEGHLTGTFRCCVFGTGPTTIRIPATRILAAPPAHIQPLFFEVSVDAEEINPPVNAMAQPWKDFLNSITDRTVVVTNAMGDAVDPTPVVDYLKKLAAEKVPAGYSTRWAIAATLSTTPVSLQAELQVLPAPAKSLTKSNLKADNCVNVQVARIPLKVEMFDGMIVAGPVPTLFASDQQAASKGLMDNADTTLEDLFKLNGKFVFMEHLTMEGAITYLGGQARKAKGNMAYPKPTIDQPAAKKQKTAAEPPPSSTGNSFYLKLLLAMVLPTVP